MLLSWLQGHQHDAFQFRCRGANITLFSPLQRVNQFPTQFFRVDFHGLTAEKNPLYLFNLTGAKQ